MIDVAGDSSIVRDKWGSEGRVTAQKDKTKPTIIATSSAMFDLYYLIFGIPLSASYVPSELFGYSDKMSYKGKAVNLITYLYVAYLSGFNSIEAFLEDVYDEKFGAGFYEAHKVLTNASFLLLNTNPFLDIPTPKTPKMI
uniref:glucuronosyltransferase n=1 Tax=Strongyloides venezuelensis TaxID=75913 RepID=A0A0K0FHW3_STRVS